MALSNSIKLWAMPCRPSEMDRSLWRVLTKHGPLEKGMANHFSIPALRIPWTEEPGRLQSMGLQRIGHDWATKHNSTEIKTFNFELLNAVLSTSVFLPWEPHEQYEKAKSYDTERWTPQVGAPCAIGEEWRNNSRKNEEMEPKQKEQPVVDVTSDASKVQCCKQQYCPGT